jgi:tight adherence protein C
MITSLLFFLGFGGALSAILWAGWKLFTVQEDPLDDRLGALQAFSLAGPVQVANRRRGGGGFWNNLAYISSRIFGDDYVTEIEKMLRTSGIRKPEAVGYYIFFQICFFLVLILGSLYLQQGKDLFSALIGCLPALILGYLLPRQVLYRLNKRYKEKLQEALPDTIDLLGIVLGTGLALDQALLRVSEEMQYIYPELSAEFYTVVMQVKAGQERAKAFNQLVRRTGIDDIKSLSAMIIQSERFGTSLSQALKVYAEALRQRRRLRAEAAIAKAGIKMLFPIILFILPALFLITLGPAVISVLRSLSGGIGGPR